MVPYGSVGRRTRSADLGESTRLLGDFAGWHRRGSGVSYRLAACRQECPQECQWLLSPTILDM